MASAQESRYGQKDSSDQNFDYMFKLLIIGNSSVGKTSFLFRYADDSFTSAFVSTVGIDFKVKTVFKNEKRIKLQIWDTAGQERYRTITTAYYRGAMGFILMYDITNEESFNAVQDCSFCMLLWPGFLPYKELRYLSVAPPASVLKTRQGWLCLMHVLMAANPSSTDPALPSTPARSTQIKTYSWDNAQVILVGNKCDMEDERVISTERGQHLGEQLGFEFFETSAKDNINVKQTFERLVDIICDKMSESLETDPAITAAKQSTRLKETPPPPQPNCGC
ncbi:ras-related protein Rab-3C isoform X3 [Fukomys damarensis]|nr:ras-related protein Rab-3C isoform X3 [Fukomys damarensis]